MGQKIMSLDVTAQGEALRFPDGTTTEQIGKAIDNYFSGVSVATNEKPWEKYTIAQLKDALEKAKSAGDESAVEVLNKQIAYQQKSTMTVVLPNGFEMTNVPIGATKVDIATHAIKKGYAAPGDFIAYSKECSQIKGCSVVRYERMCGEGVAIIFAVVAFLFLARFVWSKFDAQRLKVFLVVAVEVIAAIAVGCINDSTMAGVVLFIGLEALRRFRLWVQNKK